MRTITVGEKEYRLSPLTAGEYRTVSHLVGILNCASPGSEEHAALCCEINRSIYQVVFASLQRCNPEITAQEVAQFWGYREFANAWATLMLITSPEVQGRLN